MVERLVYKKDPVTPAPLLLKLNCQRKKLRKRRYCLLVSIGRGPPRAGRKSEQYGFINVRQIYFRTRSAVRLYRGTAVRCCAETKDRPRANAKSRSSVAPGETVLRSRRYRCLKGRPG